MGLHAYCIAPAGHEPRGTGIGDAAVIAVPAGSLCTWASQHDAQPQATMEAVRRHDGVVRGALTDTVTPVPIRFGQWSESDAELAQRIGEHEERWLALLAEFAGAIELGIRFSRLEPLTKAAAAPPRPDSGREYMQQLAERSHAREQLAAEHAGLESLADAVLRGLVQRSASGRVPDDIHGLWLAHLVRRDHIAAYRAAAAILAEQVAGYQLRVTGPWPPYSFVA